MTLAPPEGTKGVDPYRKDPMRPDEMHAVDQFTQPRSDDD